jgi:predicted kinase
MPDHLIVLNGMAAAGKTTLARPLAAALGIPLVSKDAIKEALGDAAAGLAQPISGFPVLRVDTSAPVDIASLAARVLGELA